MTLTPLGIHRLTRETERRFAQRLDAMTTPNRWKVGEEVFTDRDQADRRAFRENLSVEPLVKEGV